MSTVPGCIFDLCTDRDILRYSDSRISGACEGLFARAEIETGTTIAFYNGSRADPGEFNPDTWETNNYRSGVH